MPADITIASVQQYKSNVELLMQQQRSLLADLVTSDSYTGKAASVVEQFGEATAEVKTTRHADTPLLDLSQQKRWVFPLDYQWASLIDHQDKLRMVIDPTSPYAQAGAAAMNRAKDDVIFTAFFATNFTGENGTTSEAFSTTTYGVGVDVGGTASSINVAKLQKAVRMLMTFNKGELTEAVNAAISSYEHDALLKEVQIVNKDYNNSAVMVDGRVKRFMGVDFRVSERLNISGGNRLVPVWVKSGMHLGLWQDMITKVSERNDKSHAWQVYLCMTLGATRTQPGKVIQIAADDQI